jgi:hypothetical protein
MILLALSDRKGRFVHEKQIMTQPHVPSALKGARFFHFFFHLTGINGRGK